MNEFNIVPSSVKIDNEELVRWMNALFKHRDSYSRIRAAVNDFSYNFYGVRSTDWIKNRICCLTKELLTTQSSFN